MVFRSSCACVVTPKSEAKPSKDTKTLSFIEPPFRFMFQRRPARPLLGRAFRGAPQAGRQLSAFVHVFTCTYRCANRGGSYLRFHEGCTRGATRFTSKQRFRDVASDGRARFIAQADEFVPIRRFAAIRRIIFVRINRWRQSDRHAGRPRQICAVTEKLARARKRHWNNRHARRHSRFECAKLEWPNAIACSEGSLGKYENRFAAPQN